MPPTTPKSTLFFISLRPQGGKDSLPSFPLPPILLGQFGLLWRLFMGLRGVAFDFTTYRVMSVESNLLDNSAWRWRMKERYEYITSF